MAKTTKTSNRAVTQPYTAESALTLLVSSAEALDDASRELRAICTRLAHLARK